MGVVNLFLGLMYWLLNLLWILPVGYVLFKLFVVIATPYLPSPLNKIPGPGNTTWLSGNMKEIRAEEAMSPHMRWVQQFKDAPLIHYRMHANQERVLLVDPDAVQLALTQKELLSKDLFNYRILSKFLGDGLVTLLGNQHTEHRRMIQPAFNFHNLKGMVDLFVTQTKKLRERWRNTEEGTMVDVTSDFSKLTMNIIGLAAFGFDFDSFSENDSVGKQATVRFTNIISSGDRSPLINILMFLFPPIANLPFAVFRSVREDMEYTDDLVKALVKEKRKQMNEAASNNVVIEKKNLLELLVSSQETKSLTDKNLADHVKTLLFAGHETTATLTTWTIFALSQAPEVTAKIKQELEEKLGTSDDFSYEDLEKLVYLKAVIKETLRMYPPVAIVIRKFEKDFTYKGYTVPAGTPCTISPYLLHHNPQLWEDPEVFKPERWLTDKPRHRFQFLPFLKGPRNCIGEKFAVLEATTILAVLLREFHFEVDPKKWSETKRTLQVTMRPKPALSAILHKHSK